MPTVFPCGRGFVPGTVGPGASGQLKPVTPVVLTPTPPDDPDPPFITPPPYKPTGGGPRPPGPGNQTPGREYHACVTLKVIPCPEPNSNITALTIRACVPCNPFYKKNGLIVKDPDCINQTLDQCEAKCKSVSGICPVSGPITGAGTIPGLGTTATGATSQKYQCQELRYVCPGDEQLPLEQQRYQAIFRGCVPVNTTLSVSSGGLLASSTQLGGPYDGQEYQIWLGPPFDDEQSCSTVCVPVIEERNCNVTTGGGEPLPGVGRPLTQAPSVGEPNEPSLSNTLKISSREITTAQENLNANVISVSPIIEDENYRDIQRNILKPTLFDPELNFFETGSTGKINLVPNNLNRELFKAQVTEEISEIVNITETNQSWSETLLQNLSDDQLLASLDPTLADTFQYIRFTGGEPVGVPTMLNVIRKYILEGRVDEIDVNFFKNVAENQIDDSFEIIESPDNKEYADRLAINYLKNNLHTYQNNKSTPWQNFQINRARPLNEDLNIEVEVTTLNGTVKDLAVANEGFQVDTITAVDQITVPSVGSPNKVNIGDGGGYYIDATNLDAEGVPVSTDNVLGQAYYAPAAVRSKVLRMLGEDPALKITATSLTGKHEFASGDAGTSEVKPLFFAVDLSSVEGDYVSDSLVEEYSATYSLLTASGDIQRHLNNNALNTPVLSIDYRDPIYRYILDTSSFTLSMKDFNLAGFKDKALSTVGSRFVRNIPFGLVVTPVAGGMFNPFNGNSTLDKYGDKHTRSLKVIPATDQSIDETPAPIFRSYNLHNEDGVDRVGIAEPEDTQNIGYKYVEEDFTKTFYSSRNQEYGTSSAPASAYGTAYMLREVIDYLSNTYNTSTLTWYDVFSRMPITRVGEMFYDVSRELILEIANGLRNGITIGSIESGYNTTSRIIAEDSKSTISLADRDGVHTIKL